MTGEHSAIFHCATLIDHKNFEPKNVSNCIQMSHYLLATSHMASGFILIGVRHTFSA